MRPPTITGVAAAAPGWRVVRVLDAAQGWVVCQAVACWLTIHENADPDFPVVVPGIINGDSIWPAHLDDLATRISTWILEPGETVTAAELEELVDEQRRVDAALDRRSAARS